MGSMIAPTWADVLEQAAGELTDSARHDRERADAGPPSQAKKWTGRADATDSLAAQLRALRDVIAEWVAADAAMAREPDGDAAEAARQFASTVDPWRHAVATLLCTLAVGPTPTTPGREPPT